MIKRIIFILLISAALPLSGKAILPPGGSADSSLLIRKVRITLDNNRVIRGHIIAFDKSSITIHPFSKKGGKRVFDPIEILPYGQIQSLKMLGSGFYLLFIIVGSGLTALTLLLLRGNNNSNDSSGFVLLGPLSILAGLIGLFSRKKFSINGDRTSYLHFLEKLKKRI
jgi:hypothetical protein